MHFKPLLAGALLAIGATLILAGTAYGVPVVAGTPKTTWPGAPGAMQVGAQSSLTSAEVGANAVEFQLKHDYTIAGPQKADAYSYSVVAKTTNGWYLRMGYIVLKSDCGGAGCARWFIQVFKPIKDASGNITGYQEAYWNLSRAGAANPCGMSCSSGDDTMSGYPFSVVISGDTATFSFDWVAKAKVKISGAGGIMQVLLLGELSFLPNNSIRDFNAADMVARTALTTYRVSKSSGANGTWFEPANGAQALYLGASCPPYGAAYAGRSPTARADGVHYHSMTVGSGVSCTPAGTTLFLPSTP